MMADKAYQIEMVSDSDILAWMKSEKERLGEWYENFTITWHRSETKHILEIWANTKEDFDHPNHPHGKILTVGEVIDPVGLSLPQLQEEGRKLYFRLRKHEEIHRDLSL